MYQQKIYEEINFIVNPSYIKYNFHYLNEAILNDDDILVEGLGDQIKQRLSQLFGLRSKIPAALVGAVMMISGISGLSAEAKTKLQQKMTQGYSQSEITDLHSDYKRLKTIKKVSVIPGTGSGKKGTIIKNINTEIPFDWDSKSDLLYFVNVESENGTYTAIRDYKLGLLFIPVIAARDQYTTHSWTQTKSNPKIHIAGQLKNEKKWVSISKPLNIKELSPTIQKYYSLLEVIQKSENKRREDFKPNSTSGKLAKKQT